MRIALLTALAFCVASCAESSAPAPVPKGQNAFTRAAAGPLADIAVPVPNPKTTPCHSVVDCRKKRHDLETFWQMKHEDEHAPRDYPAHCYVSRPDGKYIYAPHSCHTPKRIN